MTDWRSSASVHNWTLGVHERVAAVERADPNDRYETPLPDELPGDKPTDAELEDEGADDPVEE